MAQAHSLENRIRHMTPVSTPPEQRSQVAALSRSIEKMIDTPDHKTPVCKLVGPDGKGTVLPETVFYMLERVVEVMNKGDSITIVPMGKEVTSQQAADLLNYSRQYLVRLLDEGRIPFRKVGKHRRVRIDDVLSYKEQRDKDRRAGLRELSQMTQDFGGYEPETK